MMARLFTAWVLGIPARLHMTVLLIRLRLLQIALHDAAATGNRETWHRVAPHEARLRASISEV